MDSPFRFDPIVFDRLQLEWLQFDRYDRGMRENGFGRLPYWLILGDGLAFVLLTLLGFARHETLQGTAWMRMLATFIPFYSAWLLIAPWLALYQPAVVRELRSVWRIPFAAIATAPLGSLLRALWLRSVVIPTFVLVMAAMIASVMLLWRGAAALVIRHLSFSSGDPG